VTWYGPSLLAWSAISGQMRRRDFITLLGTAAAWPLAGHAQQPAMPLIGFLGPATPVEYAQLVAAFRRGLNETGYTEGQQVAIEFRWAEGKYDRLPAFATDLVRRQVAVIAAMSLPAALAARSATATIPIVFADGGDPVEDGLVTSLSRPSGNLTGVTLFNNALGAKRLELLRDLVPKAKMIGLLVNPSNPNGRRQTKDALNAAQSMGLQIHVLAASNDRDIEMVFASLGERHVDALMVAVDSFFNSRRERLVVLAAEHTVPAIYYDRAFAAGGGLVSYGYSIPDAYRQAGIYTAKILGGATPADLPVIQPAKLQLVINLKTAKSLGISVPQSLRASADEVIE
jgi:putative tryptophan/tyrosine transport system substrate-binding protein